jgi:hypothetical protein
MFKKYLYIAKKYIIGTNQQQYLPTFNIHSTRNYLFIHIPKNAGTSVSRALGFDISTHATIAQVKAQLPQKQFDSYYKFCFVRNPWDRFLSLYHYARLEVSMYHNNLNPALGMYGKHLDYELLKDASLRECAYYLLDGKLLHDYSWNHWQPQVTWIKDEKGNIPMDFIGRFEQVEKDFNWLISKLSLKADLSYTNRSTKTNDYRSFYDQETKSIISRYYQEDIELFDYDF